MHEKDLRPTFLRVVALRANPDPEGARISSRHDLISGSHNRDWPPLNIVTPCCKSCPQDSVCENVPLGAF